MHIILFAGYVVTALIVSGSNANVNGKTLTQNMQAYQAQKGTGDFANLNK